MNSLNKLQKHLENEQLREENKKVYYEKLTILSHLVSDEFAKENGIKIIDNIMTIDENEVLRQKKLQQYVENGTITNINQMKYKNTYIAICEEDQPLVDEMLEHLRTLETIYNNTGDKKVYREIKNIRGIIFALCYIDNITTCNKSKSNNSIVNTYEFDFDYNYKMIMVMLKNYYQYKLSYKINVYIMDIEQALQVTDLTDVQKDVLRKLINGEPIHKDNSVNLVRAIDKLVYNLLHNNIYKMKRINDLKEFV